MHSKKSQFTGPVNKSISKFVKRNNERKKHGSIEGPVNKSLQPINLKKYRYNINRTKENSTGSTSDFSKRIIFFCPFNTFFTRQNKDCLTKAWIEDRISIFMKFTLKSLMKQTNQDFLAFIQYEDTTKSTIETSLENYPSLPTNVKFISKKDYQTKVNQAIRGYKFLYLVRLDSDDMYHKSFVQQLHNYNHKISAQVIINQNGYIFDSINYRLAKFPQKSPNYYTLIYNVKDYLNGNRYSIPGGHPNVINCLKYETINQPNYIRNVHSLNYVTTFDTHANKYHIIKDKKEIKRIMQDFM